MKSNKKLGMIQDYKAALDRLKEGLDDDMSKPIIQDGVIQRFEFTFEIAWKLMKLCLEMEGNQNCVSPRKTIKEAFQAKLIEDGDTWLDMLEDRNQTSHLYDQELASIIANRIQIRYYGELSGLIPKIEDR